MDSNRYLEFFKLSRKIEIEEPICVGKMFIHCNIIAPIMNLRFNIIDNIKEDVVYKETIVYYKISIGDLKIENNNYYLTNLVKPPKIESCTLKRFNNWKLEQYKHLTIYNIKTIVI